MKKINLLTSAAIISLLSLSACSGGAGAGVGRADVSTSPGVNSSNLTSRILSDNLIKVNSVGFAPIVVAASASEVSKELAEQSLKTAADGRLELAVVSDPAESADAKFELSINTFKKLRGSRAGASQGAEVGFELTLRDASSGEALWESNFFHRDRALSDNFLALGRSESDRMGWSDANQVLKRGLEQALQVFSNTRRSLFLRSKN